MLSGWRRGAQLAAKERDVRRHRAREEEGNLFSSELASQHCISAAFA
jgi:hypothetical protein